MSNSPRTWFTWQEHKSCRQPQAACGQPEAECLRLARIQNAAISGSIKITYTAGSGIFLRLAQELLNFLFVK
jgi:hypothetical protein